MQVHKEHISTVNGFSSSTSFAPLPSFEQHCLGMNLSALSAYLLSFKKKLFKNHIETWILYFISLLIPSGLKRLENNCKDYIAFAVTHILYVTQMPTVYFRPKNVFVHTWPLPNTTSQSSCEFMTWSSSNLKMKYSKHHLLLSTETTRYLKKMNDK